MVYVPNPAMISNGYAIVYQCKKIERKQKDIWILRALDGKGFNRLLHGLHNYWVLYTIL
jgi:hypothetical protein